MAGRDGASKKYELLEVREDGTEVRLYADGAKRNQNGRLLEKPPNAVIITPETTYEYNRKRKEKYLRAMEEKITDVTKMRGPAEAIAAIVGKRAEIAMKDKTRVGNEAARIVLQAVDAFQDKVTEVGTNVLRHEYAIDDETKALFEKIMRIRRGEEDVIEADSEDVA